MSNPVKVASICPTTEKHNNPTDGLVHRYAYPGATVDEAVALANAFVDDSVALLEKAAAHGAHFACLPEVLPNLGRWRMKTPVETMHGAWSRTWDHFTDVMSRTASRLGIHIVAGAVEPKDEKYYNAAALFDDRGNLVGTYHKVQLAGEENVRLTHGSSFPVFQTRHGKVGMSICWDMMFPEVTQCLRVNGAQIIFHPTYGHSGAAMTDAIAQTRAHDAMTPLVISMWCGNGRIIEADGTIVARGGFHRNADQIIPDQILYAELDLDRKHHLGKAHLDLRDVFYRERHWKAYAPLVEGPQPESLIGTPASPAATEA